MSRVSVFLGSGLGLAVVALVSACAGISPSAPSALFGQVSGAAMTAASSTSDATTPASIASRLPDKLAICHVAGKGAFQLLSIASAAEAAHLGHGDGYVGDSIPGMSGYVFGPNCEPVGGSSGGSSGSGSGGGHGGGGNDGSSEA